MPLGSSGWSASWSDAYLKLQVVYDSATPDTVHLRIFDEFGVGSVNPAAGLMVDPHQIVFLPTGTSPAMTLLIDAQEMLNDTGYTWDGWRMMLAGPGVTFGAPTGQGTGLLTGPQELEIRGLCVTGGQCWLTADEVTPVALQVTPGTDGAVSPFVLKQQPQLSAVVPEPAGALVAALAGALLLRRRRGV